MHFLCDAVSLVIKRVFCRQSFPPKKLRWRWVCSIRSIRSIWPLFVCLCPQNQLSVFQQQLLRNLLDKNSLCVDSLHRKESAFVFECVNPFNQMHRSVLRQASDVKNALYADCHLDFSSGQKHNANWKTVSAGCVIRQYLSGTLTNNNLIRRQYARAVIWSTFSGQKLTRSIQL